MINVYWFVVPLVGAVSLVYSASRHEPWPLIWRHAVRLFFMILGVLLTTMALLLLINSRIS